ncbi:MAG: CoA pyrophosphatase [Candidatus Eiseniibacteriota bacterium]|nr:MAG: CoA pyrophosphatase [Candidatus Eisenbacteria bacterium]
MSEADSGMQDAAVLIPLFRDEQGVVRLVLVRRVDRGIHGGQIAFPGGKRGPGDRTLLDTALREAREEIGLESNRVEVLEQLPAVETKTTGFRISPFLVRIAHPPEWCLDTREIVEVLEVRIDELARPEAHGGEIEHVTSWSGPQRSRFFHVGPYKLWGATYRILKPLVPRLAAGEWPV